jgi:hypothetical protein
MKVYKIRNSEGLFSTGSTYPNFRKVGKLWSNISHAKNHIKLVKVVGSDWEIVEFELIEKSVEKASLYKNKDAITTDELIIKNIIE